MTRGKQPEARLQLINDKEKRLKKILNVSGESDKGEAAAAAGGGVAAAASAGGEAAAAAAVGTGAGGTTARGAAAPALTSQVVVRRHRAKKKEKALKKLLNIPSRGERVGAGMTEAVAAASAGRETATSAALAPAVERGSGETAAAAEGGAETTSSPQVAVLEAVALAVEAEVKAPPSSSAFTSLQGKTDELLLACQELESTAIAVAAAAAARGASVLAEVAAAACAASELLNQEVAERDLRIQRESLKEQRVAAAELKSLGYEVAVKQKKGIMKPGDLDDDGSHGSGSTCSKTASSESTTEKGGHSEGTRGEGQQCQTPLSADAAPYPMPVQEVQDGVYLVNVRGTYYPTGVPPPPPSLLWQQGGATSSDPSSSSWAREENIAAEYSVQTGYEHRQQQQATAYYGGRNVESMTNPTSSRVQPQDYEYGGGGVGGACPLPTGPYMQQQQAFAYGDDFSSVCPTPALWMPPYAAPPMVYGGTTYYPCQMMPYVRAGV